MPEVSRLAFPSFLTAAILAAVTCYPSGAPGRDCWSERPLHGDYMPAHGDSPFEIRLAKVDPKKDPDTYTPGEFISVTIQSRDGSPFRGYLMKVYSSNGVSGGLWGARRGEQHVLKKCGVTHNNNTDITETTIMWKAPKRLMETIQFKAIVVKNYTTFYNNVLSKPLKPDYPKSLLERLFERLRAYADIKFNVTLPAVDIPSARDIFRKTVLDSSSAPAAASGPAATSGPAVTSGPAATSGAAVTSGPAATSGPGAKVPKPV